MVRIFTLKAGGPGLIPEPGARSHILQLKKKKLCIPELRTVKKKKSLEFYLENTSSNYLSHS